MSTRLPPLINRTPSLTSRRSSSSTGFRLMEEPDLETGSIYSIYKQKIDKMFESDSSEKNNVQARIERMFTEVAVEEGIKDDLGSHVFSVDYLGSVRLEDKVTSLNGLQEPLKELYFGYKKNVKYKKSLTGKLEISLAGLKVRYQGEKGDLEQLNPFPTIAVWSAVKFVLQKTSFAFLPLITDPDNIDKQNLFQVLDQNDAKYIINQSHAPLFAVVMRKIGLQKQLECHGFICQTSEDAIVIAATLYKSLMNHMKNRSNKPRNRNGVGCMSVSSSTFADSINNVPVRPPRKKRSTSGSVTSEQTPKKSTKTKKAPTVPPPKAPPQDIDEILPYEEPPVVKEAFSELSDKTPEVSELNRTRSVRRRSEDSILVKTSDFSGDILTKVTIPRSGSFLNAGGLTRYKSKINRSNGLTSGGSPLGFSELFAEFRLQENLHSLDEILAAIIKPDGMSFNDLKPIYKEFLLKLAVTLTKDELYQKAKCIMRRKKRKIRKVKGVGIGVQKLKKVFRKSFRMNISRKLKKKKLKNINLSTSYTTKSIQSAVESSISTSSYDTRQFQPKNEIVQRKASYRRKNNDKNDPKARHRRDRMSTSEDSDFFTMKRRKNKCSPNQQNRNSSSGYVSCSECSYDSDTCTCVSADKCYCSLGTRLTKPRPSPDSCPRCRTADGRCGCPPLGPALHTWTWCGCETDTCTESDKGRSQTGRAMTSRGMDGCYVSCSECSYDSDTCTCVSADKCYCSLGTRLTKPRPSPDSCPRCRTADGPCRCPPWARPCTRGPGAAARLTRALRATRAAVRQAAAMTSRGMDGSYVSCSECSYDSDTCTCVSADKCYCSLGTRLTKPRPSPDSCPRCRTAAGPCRCPPPWARPCTRGPGAAARLTRALRATRAAVRQAAAMTSRGMDGSYVSCSECSYDSDTCTCVSADKCYCSLGTRLTKPRPSPDSCPRCRAARGHCGCPPLGPALHTWTWCGCETDTCTESEKCYCQGEKSSMFDELTKNRRKDQRKNKKPLKKTNKFDPKNRIFEELQRKGFFSPEARQINPNTSKKYRKNTDQIHQIPNKSYLHSKRVQNNNNSYNYDITECQECLNGSLGPARATIFEQLEKRGFIPSGEDLTTPPNERKLCKKNSNTKSTKSVEYHHNPSEKYYEKLKTQYYDDFDDCVSQNDIRRKCISENNLIQMDLYNRELYGRALSEIGPRNGVQNSVRSFKSFNGNNRRPSTGKTLQKSIPPTSSTEALSVKKSAEIAALFTDLKLSQTTDITHILPTQMTSPAAHSLPQFPLSASQGHLRPRQFHADKKAIVTPYKHVSNNGKMIQNSLYQTRGYSNSKNNKNGLYSAKNGLYTIQSQSDSSCSDGVGKKKAVGNFENTLGYLP